MRTYEGLLVADPSWRFALVAGRFNHLVVDRLVEGAIDALRRHGIPEEGVDLLWAPGAWEIPFVVDRAARSGGYDAVVVLGAVIRGATPHFDVVVQQVASGSAAVMREAHLPVTLGVLTVDSIEQALERAGTKAGNKGAEAALAALELCSLAQSIDDAMGGEDASGETPR